MTVIDRSGNVPNDLAVKTPCIAATVGDNITLSGLQTIDGVVLVENNRVLIMDQDDPTENGIYQVSTGPWQRPNDANGNESFIQGTQVLVTQGTLNAFQIYSVTCSDDPIVIGTSELTWQGLVNLAAISNARLAAMPARTIKSNITGASAAPSDNSLSSILDLIATAWGSMIYRGTAVWQNVAPGINGQVLTSQGANAPPVWGPGTGTGTSMTDPFVEHGHFGGV